MLKAEQCENCKHDIVTGNSGIHGCVRQTCDYAPKHDTVEVVRCKDCKWRGTYKCVTRTLYQCKNPNYGMSSGVVLRDDDYCSYGERKDTE